MSAPPSRTFYTRSCDDSSNINGCPRNVGGYWPQSRYGGFFPEHGGSRDPHEPVASSQCCRPRGGDARIMGQKGPASNQ